MIRPCDNKKCASCTKVIADSHDGTAVTVPSKRLARLSRKTKSKFKVKWDTSKNVNFFHLSCWETLLDNPGRELSKPEKTTLNSVMETVEKFSSLDVVKKQVEVVVDMLVNANQIVAFTGSGVSAAAGIPTYRGAAGIDTLATLASDLTTAAAAPVNEPTVGEKRDADVYDSADADFTDYTALNPTYTHLALKQLHEMDKLHGCYTQNCDNLHAKAGLPRDLISDLHGNVFIEYCEKCLVEYERDYAVDAFSTDCSNERWYRTCPDCQWNHYTGRTCDDRKCHGKLRDTIVNFGDSLHENVCGGLRKAEHGSRYADVCLCLGSSLTVFPASNLPLQAAQLVIVNLQDTDLDNNADVRLWATSDSFFQLLLPALQIALGGTDTVGEQPRDGSGTARGGGAGGGGAGEGGGGLRKKQCRSES